MHEGANWHEDALGVVHEGGCHCGAVRFRVRVAKHRFCKTCGIHPFYTPRSHPDRVDINARCLDADAWRLFSITPFDGKNWEESSVQQTRVATVVGYCERWMVSVARGAGTGRRRSSAARVGETRSLGV